jgi:hypothetical protein
MKDGCMEERRKDNAIMWTLLYYNQVQDVVSRKQQIKSQVLIDSKNDLKMASLLSG